MPVRSAGPSRSLRQSSSKLITDTAGKTQRSPTPQYPQQRIKALSDSLMACRDKSFTCTDHYQVAKRLVSSLEHAIEYVKPQDGNRLIQPLLEWHERGQEARASRGEPNNDSSAGREARPPENRNPSGVENQIPQLDRSGEKSLNTVLSILCERDEIVQPTSS